MANLMWMSERYVYLKVKVPREVFERHLERFGGEFDQTLRSFRLRWECVLGELEHASGSAPGPSVDRVL